MNRVIILIAAVAVVFGGGYLLLNRPSSPTPAINTSSQESSSSASFATPKKSAHYESNAPEHALTLAGAPVNVVINFNFDLAKPSEIKIERDGKDFGVGETVIDGNKLSMRRNMDSTASEGVYTANYNACWPDGSCHDGSFQFAIDKSLGAGFVDETDKNEVEIKMSQIMFSPKDIKVSKGTKIRWVNDDSVGHYINTDS